MASDLRVGLQRDELHPRPLPLVLGYHLYSPLRLGFPTQTCLIIYTKRIKHRFVCYVVSCVRRRSYHLNGLRFTYSWPVQFPFNYPWGLWEQR